MMKEKVKQYLRIEKEIEALNERLKQQKKEREMIGNEIMKYCQSVSKNQISLPDGSNLKIYNNKTYQSLSYSMLERNLQDFNTKHSLNIPVKQFIDYLKLQRDSKTSMEMRYFRS